MSARIRVYIAMSLDGFIAGPNDELDWLSNPAPDGELTPGVVGFDAFMSEIGAMLMGRSTYDVVSAMEGPWFYGDTPILVPTHRPLDPIQPTVRPVSGTIDELLDLALDVAGGKDVYIDGGSTISAALDAGRVDELIVTVAPVALGAGKPLFAGTRRHRFEILSHLSYAGGMVQLRMRHSACSRA